MFGKKETKMISEVTRMDKRIKMEGMETIIGSNTIVKGEIQSTGTIRIDGKIEGKIIAEGDVIIGDEGMIKADVVSKNVVIGGKVEGNIEARERLEVSSTGRLVGNIKANSLKIDEGAVFIGKSQMLTEEVKDIEEVREDTHEQNAFEPS